LHEDFENSIWPVALYALQRFIASTIQRGEASEAIF
jgi:hypothetical protein